MTANKLGAVVVGTGFGVLTHVRALRAAGIDVVALVGRDPQKTKERAQGAGIEQGLTSLGQALELPGVDIVTIATPPHTHASIALQAIAAGKHIVCEKPFAKNADEGQQMLDAAESAGVLHRVGAEFRWATPQALATQAINTGAIGKPKLATFMLHMPLLTDPNAQMPTWWTQDQHGGGWLGAYGSHVIDQARAMCGEFVGLSASLSKVSERNWSVEDSYTVHFRTTTGVNGILQSSIGDCGSPIAITRVVGSDGTLSIDNDKVVINNTKGSKELEAGEALQNAAPIPPPSELLVTAYDMWHSMGTDLAPYTKLFETLQADILGQVRSSPIEPATFADGLAMQKILDAIRLSSKENNWIKI
jgi:predicted dehydrogenase